MARKMPFTTTVLAPDECVPIVYIELPADFEPGSRVVVLPDCERVTLATDGRNYVSEGMDPAQMTTEGKTWWYVEAILVPASPEPDKETP